MGTDREAAELSGNTVLHAIHLASRLTHAQPEASKLPIPADGIGPNGSGGVDGPLGDTRDAVDRRGE